MMQQLELLSIENPCIGVCQTDNRGYCKGCFRSRDERYDWAELTPPQKRKVLELCKGRGKRRIAKQKAQQKAQTQIAITTVTNDSHKKESHQTDQQQEQQKNQSCVGDCDQSVQDMGLDLFDL